MDEGTVVAKAVDAGATARKAIDDISASATQNAAAARDTIKESYKGAKEALGEVVDRGTKAAKGTKDYVEAHPWVAVGAGVAVGILLGAIAHRR